VFQIGLINEATAKFGWVINPSHPPLLKGRGNYSLSKPSWHHRLFGYNALLFKSIEHIAKGI